MTRSSAVKQAIILILLLRRRRRRNRRRQNRVWLINKALEFIEVQRACESLLTDLEEGLSSDMFDKVKAQVYDVGTVVEETQEGAEGQEQLDCFPLTNYDKLLCSNKLLSMKIDTMYSSNEEARTRLQVIIQWWEEFQTNYDDVIPWLEGAESDVSELIRRYSNTSSPRHSPMVLLQELKTLSVEVEDRSIIVCAIESSSGNILEEMGLKGINPKELPEQVEHVRTKWEELREKIRHHLLELESSSESFHNFLTRLTSFLNWLSVFHAHLYDEVCVKLPSEVSQDLIGQLLNQLEVFRAEVITKKVDKDWLLSQIGNWAEYKIPRDVLSELPSPAEMSLAPGSTDEEEEMDGSDQALPYVKTGVKVAMDKWGVVQRLLEARETDLEMSSNSYQVFRQQAEKLFSWLRGKLDMNALSATPPADLEVVEGYHMDVKMTRSELETKLASLKALTHMAEELQGQVSSAIVQNVEEMMQQMVAMWDKLDKGSETREEAEQWTNHIAEIVASWTEFSKTLEVLIKWTWQQELELTSLHDIEEFAGEFSSHQTRMKLLMEDLECHRPVYNVLVNSSHNHIHGESPEVQFILKRYRSLEEAWDKMVDTIKQLCDRTKPWVEFIDRSDELCLCLGRLEKSTTESEMDVRQMRLEEGGDLSDKIVMFKSYLMQVSEMEPNVAAVKEGEARLLPPDMCEAHEGCRELQKESVSLRGRWRELEQRIKRNLEQLNDKEVAWKNHAKNSILLVDKLKSDLQSCKLMIQEREVEIEQLRNMPPSSSRPSSITYLPVVGVFLMVLLALVFMKKEQSPFKPL